MAPATIALVVGNQLKKGDVLGTASFAGRTAGGGGVNSVEIDFSVGFTSIEVCARVHDSNAARALQAAAVAALTIYDMCKSADRSMVITDVGIGSSAA